MSAPARLKARQEQELLAPAADDADEEEESEYETDSEEEDGFGRAMLKPVFVPKVGGGRCFAFLFLWGTMGRVEDRMQAK